MHAGVVFFGSQLVDVVNLEGELDGALVREVLVLDLSSGGTDCSEFEERV